MTGKQLKNSILQWAIQGKLVPQDPNDEPASVLLEKIRAEKARLVKEGKIKKDKNESIIYRGEDNSYYEKFANGKVVCIDDEIPFEIPDTWCWARLGHIFEHNTGKALNSSNQTGQLKTYITTSNLYWNYFNLTSLKQMYFSDSEIAKCTVTKGDLLVCEGGDIGRAAIWNYEYDICVQNHIHRLRAYIDIETKFFYYIFLLYKGLGYIGGKGIGIQGLSSGALHNILVPVPSVSEQFRITAYFEQIEPIIDKYNAIQIALNSLNTDIYVQLRKSILQEAIQGKLVAQNPEEEPASILLQRIQDEKLRLVKEGKLKKKDVVDSIIFKSDDNKYYEQVGSELSEITDNIPFDIPNGWEWGKLSTVTYSVGNKNNQIQTKDILKIGYIPVVSQGQNLVDGYCNNKDKKITDLPLIMFGDHTRNVKYIDFEFVIGADGTKFHKCIFISPKYLFYWMIYAAEQLRNRGYARHYSLLKQTYLPIPPLSEQLRIVDMIETIFDRING